MQIYPKDHKIYQIALLVALACILQISESMIPHPIPGLRLGLANMVTLTTLVLLGFRHAMEVALIRTILSSLIIGTFMSPGFILSFSAAIASTLIMGFFYWLSGLNAHLRFSIIGISIVGAFCHNMVQLVLAYFLLVKHSGIFVFFPWLSIGAVATGWVVGIVAGGVCRQLAKASAPVTSENASTPLQMPAQKNFQAGTSLLHRAKPEIKILGVFLLALLALIFDDYRLNLALAGCLLLSAITSRTPFTFLWARVTQYTSLIAVAFFFPVFFNSGSHVLTTIAAFKITSEGMATGSLFAARIVILIIASSLLLRTTSPDNLTRGIAQLMSPLHCLGMDTQRFAQVLSLSWSAVPYLWETARATIRRANLGRAGNLKNLLPLLSTLIAGLYLETGSTDGFWQQTRKSENGDSMEVAPKR
ncbi:MAG: Gx transporter family protein [Desulfobacterales bacterium]